MIPARVAGLLLVVLSGCVPRIDDSHAPCPCDADHECCPTLAADRCVPKGQLAECALTPGCAFPDGQPQSWRLAQGFPDSDEVQPLDTTGALPLNQGFQGGLHVYLQLLPRVYPGSVTAALALRDPATGATVDQQQARLELVCDHDQWQLRQGLLTFICLPPGPPVPVHDRTMELDVTLPDDAQPRIFSIDPTCPTDASRDHCVAVCGG
jgi:hypothetical protein